MQRASEDIKDWEDDVRLFCEVAIASCERVVVVTCNTDCFPAFQDHADVYNDTVTQLREWLDNAGIVSLNGDELRGLPTYDGYHFSSEASHKLLDAATTWFQLSAVVGNSLLPVDAKEILMKAAIAPKMPRRKQQQHWWDFRSIVSGGVYEPWCLACDKVCRSGHETSRQHQDQLLRRYGVEPGPGPPVYMLILPTGSPKKVSASCICQYTAANMGEAIELKNIVESGLRCQVGKGMQYRRRDHCGFEWSSWRVPRLSTRWLGLRMDSDHVAPRQHTLCAISASSIA